jgi:hypothetical protein
MKTIVAFLLGIWEFRSGFTIHYNDTDLMYTYDAGREFMHRLTFRRYDPPCNSVIQRLERATPELPPHIPGAEIPIPQAPTTSHSATSSSPATSRSVPYRPNNR